MSTDCCTKCGSVRIKTAPSGRRYCIPCRLAHEKRRKSQRRCSCGADVTSLNPAEVIVHRTDGPCYFAPAIANGDDS